MGLTGRHRMRTHAGIPHGSSVGAGSNLMIYYQYNTGETGTLWNDQSPNNNDAVQESEELRPAEVSGGGLDFEDTNSAESASQMGFTKFTVEANTDFISFIVCKPEDATNTLCYLSDSGSEVFQFTSANQHQFKAGSSTPMTHSSIFTCTANEKQLVIIHRTNTTTGTLKIYKNGLVCNGHNNSGSTNTGVFDLQNLGVKNNPESESNWFDGIIYDIGIIKGATATDKVREMITDYLCLKHGIQRLS
tara:strand:- start:3130 stop:3870 length:741 start_codon:yes stop_codon:yes gene_type:complete